MSLTQAKKDKCTFRAGKTRKCLIEHKAKRLGNPRNPGKHHKAKYLTGGRALTPTMRNRIAYHDNPENWTFGKLAEKVLLPIKIKADLYHKAVLDSAEQLALGKVSQESHDCILADYESVKETYFEALFWANN